MSRLRVAKRSAEAGLGQVGAAGADQSCRRRDGGLDGCPRVLHKGGKDSVKIVRVRWLDGDSSLSVFFRRWLSVPFRMATIVE